MGKFFNIQAVATWVTLSFLTLLFIFPFVWMVSTSLKDAAAATALPPQIIPSSVHWVNYKDATLTIPFWQYSWNTLYLCIVNVIGMTISSAMVAYGLSFIKWWGAKPLFGITLATLMVPFPVMLVPQYSIFRDFGWIGTFLPLWVPAFCGGAYNIFLLRQFFLSIPGGLREAAMIDGCSELKVFLLIVLPLTRSALLVVAVFHFLFVWNDFIGPLIYIQDVDMFTLSLGPQNFQSRLGGTDYNLLMAASVLMILPIMTLFFLAQNTFIEGISLSGIKE
jgi:multiple sugar transport system permease protein